MKRLSLSERTLARIQQIVTERGFSHDALAPHLGVGASAVSKLLSGKNAIGLDHIEGFAFAFQMTPAEIVMEPGSLLQPLTASEAALLREFRSLTESQRIGLLAVLERAAQQTLRHRRRRLNRAELSDEQQQLVELFAQSEPQAREGVLKILRGTARKGAGDGRHAARKDE